MADIKQVADGKLSIATFGSDPNVVNLSPPTIVKITKDTVTCISSFFRFLGYSV